MAQLRDILPGIFLAVLMGVCILPLQMLPLPTIVIVVMQVLLGAGIYIGASAIFKMEAFEYLWKMAEPVLHNGKENRI